MKNINNLINIIKSVMIGHAVGDALGVPVEFASREELEKAPVTDMEGYGTYPMPAGAWSDDTSMALAALDSLASGKVDWDEIMKNFGRWLSGDAYTPTGECFDAGKTCVKAILNYFKDKMPHNRCGEADERSNGNGSLMRIHPFVLYAYMREIPFPDWMDFVKSASSLTHAHERSVVGCLIYTFVLIHLCNEQNIDSLKLGLRRAECHLREYKDISHYQRIFDPDFEKLTSNEIKSTGYVVDTLEAALWCLLTTDNYRDCVLKAVNLGGDTDTIAAVAGGLAGAIYGYDAIPEEWRNTLIKREYIEEMCERACQSWENKV